MARRRKKSRRKSNKIQAKRRTSSVAVNFIAFAMGMATTVLITAMVYAAATHEPTEVENSVVDRDPGLPVEYDAFDSLLTSNDVGAMSRKLIALKGWPRGADLPVRISENRKRERLARKLSSIEGIAETDRVLAGESLIEALSAIYGLDLFYKLQDRDVASELQVAALEYSSDSSPRLVRASQLALLKYHAFEFVKGQQEPERYPPLEKSLMTTLNDYSDDEFAVSNVKLIFRSLSQLAPKVSTKLTKVVMAKRSDFADTKAGKLITELADRDLLLKSNYGSMFENKWVFGSSGQTQLLKTSLELLSNRDSGEALITDVDQTAQWFEQVNKYAQAKQIYQTMVDTASRVANPVANELAKELGQNGLTRINSIGQPAKFSGVDINGRPFTAGRFKRKIVAVIFWSIHDEASKAELVALHTEKMKYASMPVDALAICVDKVPGKGFGKFIEGLSRFRCSDPAKYGSEGIPFSRQCPVTRVPHILLIDAQGNISDSNVAGDSLRTHIEGLTTKR